MTVQSIIKIIFLYIFAFRIQILCRKTLDSLFSESTDTFFNQCDVSAMHLCIAECIGLQSTTYKNQSNICKFNFDTGEVMPPCDVSKMEIDKQSKMKVICGLNVCNEGQMCPPLPVHVHYNALEQCTHVLLDNFIEIKSNKTHKYALSVDAKKNKFHNVDVVLENKSDVKIIGSVTGSAKAFSNIAASGALRSVFISQVKRIIELYNLDGIEIQWRFPYCWQGNCSAGGLAEDSVNLVTFLSEIKNEFESKNWLITSILPYDYKIIESAFELEDTIKYLDWMIVETHNYHLASPRALALHAPLNEVKATMEDLKKANIDHSKLIIRLSSFMVVYDLPVERNKKEHERKAPSVLPGSLGNLSNEFGTAQPFNHYCHIALSQMTVVHASESIPGSYMYSITLQGNAEQFLNRWMSIEDMYSIGKKMKYVNKYGFGGAMLEGSEFDDVQDKCQCGPSPLLRAINNGLRGQDCEIPHCILGVKEAMEKMEQILQSGNTPTYKGFR